MKIIICGLALMFNLSSLAAPNMSTATGVRNNRVATIVPDHETPNLYYIFPQGSSVNLKQNNTQDFLYLETRDYRWKSYFVKSVQLSIGIKVNFENPELIEKIEAIKNQDPAAKFSMVTPIKTEVTADESLKNVFLESSCNQLGGPLEVPVYCMISVNPELTHGFRQLLQFGPIRVLQYTYHFYGWAKDKLEIYSFTVPLNVGSLDHDEYFIDQYGGRI